MFDAVKAYVRRVSLSSLLTSAVFVFCCAALGACGTYQAMQEANEHAVEPGKASQGCQLQCMNWGESCEVDARGVRVCARRCTDLKNVCE